MTDTDTNLYDTAVQIAENVTPYDRILFNDRSRPITVTDIRKSDHRDETKLNLEGPQGGRYELVVNEDLETVHLKSRLGEYRTVEEYNVTVEKKRNLSLNSLTITEDTLTLKKGQVFFELTETRLKFIAVNGVDREYRHDFGAEIEVVEVVVDTETEEITQVQKQGVNERFIKDKLFEGRIEPHAFFRKRQKFIDEKKNERATFLGFGETGVWLNYESGSKYLDWSHFLPEPSGRFTQILPETGQTVSAETAD